VEKDDRIPQRLWQNETAIRREGRGKRGKACTDNRGSASDTSRERAGSGIGTEGTENRWKRAERYVARKEARQGRSHRPAYFLARKHGGELKNWCRLTFFERRRVAEK